MSKRLRWIFANTVVFYCVFSGRKITQCKRPFYSLASSGPFRSSNPLQSTAARKTINTASSCAASKGTLEHFKKKLPKKRIRPASKLPVCGAAVWQWARCVMSLPYTQKQGWPQKTRTFGVWTSMARRIAEVKSRENERGKEIKKVNPHFRSTQSADKPCVYWTPSSTRVPPTVWMEYQLRVKLNLFFFLKLQPKWWLNAWKKMWKLRRSSLA